MNHMNREEWQTLKRRVSDSEIPFATFVDLVISMGMSFGFAMKLVDQIEAERAKHEPIGPLPSQGKKTPPCTKSNDSDDRKMSPVVQGPLGKETRCAPPLHPPGHGSSWALNPFQSQQTESPVNHSQDLETSLSTCTEPWIKGRIAAP